MKNTYYVRKNESGSLYELCQNRFKNNPDHPYNVCAVASTQKELREMYAQYLSGGVDWLKE